MNRNLFNGLWRGGIFTQIFLLGLLVWSAAHAQLPLPDPAIQLVANGDVFSSATAPDGSVVIGGRFTTINGVARRNIARLQPDGTLDPDWNPGANCYVFALAVDTSGDIYAGGCFSLIGGKSITALAKLSSTGSGTADPTWNPQVGFEVYSLAVDGTGGLYVGGELLTVAGQPRSHLAKLSTTGAGNLDMNWDPNPTSTGAVGIRGLAVDAGGAVYVAGDFQNIGGQVRAGLAKLSPSGTGDADPDWNPNPSATSYLSLESIAVDETGAVFVGGHFENIGGEPRNNIAKLSGSGAGTADATWNPGSNGVPYTLTLDDSDAIYVGGFFSIIGGQARSFVAKLSTSGSGAVDPSWNPGTSGKLSTIALAGSDSVIIGGDFDQAGGQVHASLALISSGGDALVEANAERQGTVSAIAVQPGGGTIVGGEFSQADQQTRNNILRLQADGTLDLTWNPGAAGVVSALVIGSSGAVYAGGAFSSIGGLSRDGFAKLSGIGNGAADPAWNSSPSCVSSAARLAIDETGAVYVSGCFSSIGGQSRQQIAKLSGTTGAADTSWNPGVDGQIYALATDGAGAIYAGGVFQNIGGQSRINIAKLSASGTGSADPSWNPAADNLVYALAIDDTGSVYAGGVFESIGGQQRSNLAKLSETTGAADAAWNPGGCGAVTSLVLDGNGSLFTAGWGCAQKFSTAGLGVAMSWDPQPAGRVDAVALHPDGNVYLGGFFTTVAGQPRDSLAAVPPIAAPIPSVERQVLLDLYVSTDGDNWTMNTDWNGPVGTECSWFGITCADGHVVRVILGYNNLNGTLPALGGLSALQVLVVNGNQLSGSIPSLTEMTALSDLDFSKNQMSGAFPALGTLTHLRTFRASENQLTGTIQSMDMLTNLQRFSVSDNQLSGSIPALNSLTSLSSFSAAHNQLSGAIPALDTLTNLTAFSVGGNQLTGTIPALDTLTRLQLFSVWKNQLTGAIPPLNNLTYLSYFLISNNRLTGPLPDLPMPNNIQPGDASVCPNELSPFVDNAAWDFATGITPWWSACESIFANGFE